MTMPPESTENDNDLRKVEQNGFAVVSVQTDEVPVTVGPRRITGLIFHSAQQENEARSARVYHDAAKRG